MNDAGIDLPKIEDSVPTRAPVKLRAFHALTVIAVVGVAVSLLAAFLTLQIDERLHRTQLQAQLLDLSGRIEAEIETHFRSLRSIRAHFVANNEAARDSFNRFAGVLTEDDIGTIAYGWAPLIAKDDIKVHEARMQAEGLAGYEISYGLPGARRGEESNRSTLFPISVVAPENTYSSLHGVDLASLPGVADRLFDSIDQDAVMLSTIRATWPFAHNDDVGVAALPVYDDGTGDFLVSQRRRQVKGVLFSVVNIRSMIAYAVRGSSIDNLVADGSLALQVAPADTSSAEVYFETETFQETAERQSGALFKTDPILSSRFIVGQFPIEVRVVSNRSHFEVAGLVGPGIVLFVGLTLTGIVCLFVYTTIERERRVQHLVEHRTRALEESQRRIVDMADVAADWFWETDEDLRFTYISKRFEDVTGLSRDPFLGRTRAEVIENSKLASRDTWEQHLDDLQNHRPISDFRYTMTVDGDRDVHFATNGKPIYDADGKFIGYRGSGRDVTNEELSQRRLRESEERLQRYVEELEISRQYLEENAMEVTELAERYAFEKERAEASERSKSEFLASMSHEIRTPMTGVMGFADMLLDSDLGEDDREKVLKIKAATQSLLTILNDILDLSKLDAGKLRIEKLDFNLRYAIEEAMELVRERARHKAISLSMEFSDDLPDGINGDPTRVRQILINLIGNAVKFTHAGGVTVQASFRPGSRSREVVVRVVDTGIGISTEDQERLFSEFMQADATIYRRYEGTGLGLSISKRLTNLLGGEIGVESVVGKGSTFWFTLPFVAATSDVSRALRQTIIQEFETLRPLDILVAEDNKLNQRIIAAVLDKVGHRSTIVENGLEAVEASAKEEFDLILMDIRMPEMSGPDATRTIRAKGGKSGRIPIIALTADAMEDHIQIYMDSGMSACVAKPIDRPVLLGTINEVMGEEIHVPKSEAVGADPITEKGTSEKGENNTAENSGVSKFLDTLDVVADAIDKNRNSGC